MTALSTPALRRWVLVALAVAASLLVYSRLPEQVPVHWNIDGDVDRWGDRWQGAFLAPVIMAGIVILASVLPSADPRPESYAKMRGTYTFIFDALLLFMLVLHAVTLASGLGYRVPVTRVVVGAVGVLFIALGNVMPRTRPNWYVGVRTPWTLSNDRVWTRTHRVAGYLLAGAGLLTIASVALPGPWAIVVLVGSIVGAGLGSAAYSYVAWKQETRA